MKLITNFKHFTFLMVAIGAGILFLANCGKKTYSQAPRCVYGQALIYDDRGFSCQYVNPPANQPYGPMYSPTPAPGAVSQFTPPVFACPNSQVLVNWRGNWFCYNAETLYPNESDTPAGITPPPGKGGEFCTASGMTGQGYSNPYYNQGNPNSFIACSPGFYCIVQQQQAYPTATPVPGMPNPYNPNGPYQPLPQSGYFGQPGTCQYSGYRPI